jgi:hypothetical protein
MDAVGGGDPIVIIDERAIGIIKEALHTRLIERREFDLVTDTIEILGIYLEQRGYTPQFEVKRK